MSLKIEVGDVFNELLVKHEAGKPVIFMHGCNAQGVMGSGVAALVKKLYPFAYERYKAVGKKNLKMGEVYLASDDSTTVSVANAITQEFYGRDGKAYLDYDAIINSCQIVAAMARTLNSPVYLPLIGGGLGGGDKKRLIAIFQAVFHDIDATLWLQE